MVALILMTASIYEIKENSEDVMKYMPVTNKVIILDAGHGGIDSGTLNDDKTILEKDINIETSRYCRKRYLENFSLEQFERNLLEVLK